METCRLCLLHQPHHMNIFNNDVAHGNVIEVINKHIGEVTLPL